jgi:glycerophosphoryl diester phosphodiesterase
VIPLPKIAPRMTQQLASSAVRCAAFSLLVLYSRGTALLSGELPHAGISQYPFPWVIAHKGGDLLWPEETMEAYVASTAYGNHFVDVDCQLLDDGTIALMHDGSLNRTTTSSGTVATLDAGNWKNVYVDGHKLLGSDWNLYRAPFLDEILTHFGNREILSVEPKDGISGVAIINKLKEYHIARDYVFVNSFAADQLQPAIAAGYLTCLNLPPQSLLTPEQLRRERYWAVALPASFDPKRAALFKAAGLRVFIYSINRHYQWQQFEACGADGFYADDPLYMAPDLSYRRDSDPFGNQCFQPGMLEAQPGGRGIFRPPDSWELDTSSDDSYKSCLQGWMCPIGGNEVARDWTMRLSISFWKHFDLRRWAGVSILTSDVAMTSSSGPHIRTPGYHILFHNTGGLSLYRFSSIPDVPPALLATCGGKSMDYGETVSYVIQVTPKSIAVRRADDSASISAEDSSSRGAYISFGVKGQQASFSHISITYSK